jgi:molybdenum cofactor biosynthesis enzyme MoaA
LTRRDERTVLMAIEGRARLVNPFLVPPGDAVHSLESFRARLASLGAGPRRELVLGGGEPTLNPALGALLAAARAAGFQSVRLLTDALSLGTPEAARRLRSAGVTALGVPLLAPQPAAFDRLAGLAGACARALRGVRHALEAGLAVELQAWLVDPAVQDPRATVALAGRVRAAAGGGDLAVVFRAAEREEAFSAAPGWSPAPLEAFAAPLEEACRAADGLGVLVRLPSYAGLPACLLSGDGATRRALVLPPPRPAPTSAGFVHAATCAACALRGSCLGLRQGYAARFGTAALVPFARRPAGLGPRRSRPWDASARQHARRSDLRVLRLTVGCNQRCVFCSSDDTALNLEADPKARLQRIHRWARLGVRRLSLSGGEPTLDPQLPELVAYASRLGFSWVEVVTNAVRLADPRRARRLVEAGLTQATVSLHAHTAQESERLTAGRAGDFQATLAGVDHLLESGRVTVFLNHVIHAANAASLPDFVRFVHARFGTAPRVTFAFLTPLNRALGHPELMPRYTEVAGPLKLALDEGVRLGLNLEVLSRPGIPPCILAPDHLQYSDLARIADQAAAEDAHQKVKPPTCRACRYDALCTGVWQPYAERFGLAELIPVPSGAGRRGSCPS